MSGNRNEVLSDLLDKDDISKDTTLISEELDISKNDNLPKDFVKLVQISKNELIEERMEKMMAEDIAEDKKRRLAVAQQQLSEYAKQKEDDASALEEEFCSLESMFNQLIRESGSISIEKIKNQLVKVKTKISEQSEEARAFSMQQKADLDRSNTLLNIDKNREELIITKKADENNFEIEDNEDEESDLETDSDDETSDDEMKPLHNSNGGSYDEMTTNGYHKSVDSVFIERSKYIPLRLSYEERNYLKLIEAALYVSEYTDKVDIMTWQSKSNRVVGQIRRMCAILSGLAVAQDYKKGQKLVQCRDFSDNEEFFQEVFEIGRRYKIMNPDKMRSEYGKLIYMLMDSADPQMQELLDFKCIKPLKTVYTLLKENNGLQLLNDPLMNEATAEIVAGGRPRHEIQRDIRTKERAIETLSKKYSSHILTKDDVMLCLYSIGDHNSYLLFNRDPIDDMIVYLKHYFNPDEHESGLSLSISMGMGGSRLSHSHERQYHYVLQTLTLWREISSDMFKLWYLAESDLLNEGNYYRLSDTGQGFNRVQQAPLVRNAIYEVIERCRTKIGHWVGSAVVHLGDHNVPNALMFIDKYTQVPRILHPVVLVIKELPRLYHDANLKDYINSTFGSLEQCRQNILADFFRHAFDGSGADNFFDAGSCIDGRLTSAWNWCSKLEKKPYYHIFKVAGFVGFDGDFQK